MNIVNTAVVEVYVPSVLGRGPAVVLGSLGVFSHQQSRHKHGLELSVAGVVVRVLCIQGKITAYIWEHEDVSVSVMSF